MSPARAILVHARDATLTRLHAEARMNAFVFWPAGDRERQSRLFAEEVVPAVREAAGSAPG